MPGEGELLAAGVALLRLAIGEVPALARIIARGIAASRDTDDSSAAEYVASHLEGDGYSAAVAAKIRKRRGLT